MGARNLWPETQDIAHRCYVAGEHSAEIEAKKAANKKRRNESMRLRVFSITLGGFACADWGGDEEAALIAALAALNTAQTANLEDITASLQDYAALEANVIAASAAAPSEASGQISGEVGQSNSLA